jgi:hypothetical protein
LGAQLCAVKRLVHTIATLVCLFFSSVVLAHVEVTPKKPKHWNFSPRF